MPVIDYEAQRIAHIAESAAISFKDHVIETRLHHGLFRHWFCHNLKSNAYWFSITTTPGRLIVAGDIGCLVVERVPDMIEFARTSIRDIDYFAGKVTREIATREYDMEIAKQWCLKEMLDQSREDRAYQLKHPANEGKKTPSQRFREELSDLRHEWGDSSMWTMEHHIGAAIFNSGIADGCDMPDLKNWRYDYLWCREAGKWFLAHMPEPPKWTLDNWYGLIELESPKGCAA